VLQQRNLVLSLVSKPKLAPSDLVQQQSSPPLLHPKASGKSEERHQLLSSTQGTYLRKLGT
jgi:hypothetical protein